MNECWECVNNDTPSCMFYNQCNKRKKRKRLITEFNIDYYMDMSDKKWCDMMCGEVED